MPMPVAAPTQDITPEDLLALAGVPSNDPSSLYSLRPGSLGAEARTREDMAAIKKPLPIYNPSAAVVEGNKQANAAVEAMKSETQIVREALDAQNVINSNVYEQVQKDIDLQAGIARTNVEGEQQITARNRFITNENNTPDAEVIARAATKRSEVAKALLQQLTEIDATDNETGVVGILKKVFVRPFQIDQANHHIAVINALDEVQTELIKSNTDRASHEISLLPLKTPEQEAADLAQVSLSASKLHTKASLDATASAKEYYDAKLSTRTLDMTGTAQEAARRSNLDYATFSSRVEVAKHDASAVISAAQMEKLTEDVRLDANLYMDIEAAFGLRAGEGKAFFPNVLRVNPQAAGAVMEMALSETTSSPELAAQAMRYNKNATPSQRATADAILNTYGKFGDWLVTNKKATSLEEFKKLPPPEQEVIRRGFYSSSAGEVPSPVINAKVNDMASALVTSVPTGSIDIPAIMNVDGSVRNAARSIKLRNTGALGEKLASLDGQADAAYALAAQEIAAGRAPAEVATELSNFFKNVNTAQAAFKGKERKLFGLPIAKTFKQQVHEKSIWSPAGAQVTIDMADYNAVLASLARGTTAQFTEAVEGMISGFSSTQGTLSGNASAADLIGAPK